MKNERVAIMGTYFKYLKAARKKAEEKNRLWRKQYVDDSFTILKIDNGYLVVSKRQLEAFH